MTFQTVPSQPRLLPGFSTLEQGVKLWPPQLAALRDAVPFVKDAESVATRLFGGRS